MRNEEKLTWKQKLKKRLPLLIFLTISTTIFFLASALLLDESYYYRHDLGSPPIYPLKVPWPLLD